MPVWRVDEPFINLWVEDEPLVYRPTYGPAVVFRMSFKQRADEEMTFPNEQFSLGKSWKAAFITYLDDFTPSGTVTNVALYLPGGGRTSFANGDMEPVARGRIERLTGSANSGFKVHYPDGKSDEYNLVVSRSSHNRIYLTARRDGIGNMVQYVYSTNAETPVVVRLLYIVDAAGQTNFLTYATNHAFSTNLIASITDPHGRSASFSYSEWGLLTNIVDAAGMVSSFGYNTNSGWITNLTTPYGTTFFNLTNFVAVNPGPLKRSAMITHPDGLKEAYYYSDSMADLMLPPTEQFPALGSMPDAARNQLGDYACAFLGCSVSQGAYMNSAYWNRQQFTLLSSGAQSDITALSSNDLRLARLRHWRNGPIPSSEDVTDTLGFERPPFPAVDATETPLVTWYGYRNTGTQNQDFSQPTVFAMRMPDDTTRFIWRQFNYKGNLTNEIQSYADASGAVALRTNRFVLESDLEVSIEKAYDFAGHLVQHNNWSSGLLLVSSSNAVGEVTSYSYDGPGQQVSKIVSPSGLVTSNFYSASGQLTQTVQWPTLATNIYGFTRGLLTTNIDARGLKTIHTYDALDRLTSTLFPDGTYTSNRYTHLDVTATKDRLGNWTYFGYDSLRRQIAMTNALGAVTTNGYCECGGISSVTDALGQTTQFFYDLAGRQISTHFPDGSWTSNIFDRADLLVVVLNSAGNRVTNAYNLQGNVYARSNAFGELSFAVFDIEDHVLKQWNELGTLTTNVYDDLGRLVASVDSGSQWKNGYRYTTNGLVAFTNQSKKVTTYINDAAGRKLSEMNANGEQVNFTYNTAGDLTMLMDAAERETRWNYDEYGRVTNKVDHLGNVLFIYKYDANGRLTNRWTPVKGHTGYAYDAVGNLTNVNYAASPDLSFRYDVLNRVTNMVDAAGVTRYTYGVAGDLTSEDGPWTGDTVSATQTNGLRASLAVAADAGVPPQAWAYGYDSMSRLRAMSSPAGSFSQSYWLDKPTRLVGGIGLPTGGYRTNNYTALGLLTLTALKSSTGTTLDSYGYSRDSGGPQPIRLTRNVDGSTVDYSYDNALQLTGATGKEGGGANRRHEQFAYDYDAAGNLIARTASWLEEGFSVNNLNQITARTRIGSNVVAGVVEGSPTSVSVNSEAATIYADNTFSWLGYDVLDDEDYVGSFTAQAQDAAGRTATHTISVNLPAYLSYQYDLNGNLLTDGRRHFTYDDENQLTQVVVTNLTKSEFVYDGKMRRRVRKESVWSGQWQQVLEVHYLYDGNLVVQERHYDGAAPTAYPQRLVTYTRGTDLSGGRQGAGGIGGLLAWSEYTGQDARLSTAFYHNDMVGNVTLLAGTNQEVVARYLYEPFGRLIAMTGPLAEANTHRSSSKEAHEPSGLVYYLYRYYEPGLQRWANRDPIFELGGINLYKFTRNRPTDAFDAFGLCDCAQMQKDIQNFRAAREKLENMFMRYEPGQSFRDYGLGVAATTGGYRSPNFSTYDTCTQEAINNIEGDSAFTTAATLYQSMVGAVGYYTFGLHGLFNGTSAAEQWGLTYIRIELTRNQLLLNKLSDRYGSECSCSSGQNVVPFELPQIKPPITVK